jgi:tetratricopeptide (TPR) repeat protein
MPELDAEEILQRAMGAATPRARGLWARRGLAKKGVLDRATQAMLLRQLYLAYYEQHRFHHALQVAEQAIQLEVLPDVAHQDAARAHQALDDTDGAVAHLRLAARMGPPNRRPFHWWTLGALCYLARRYDDAVNALARAVRWGTTDRPLYLAHLVVVCCERGDVVPDIGEVFEHLRAVPAGQGYGRFVLGQLAYFDRRPDEARHYLEAFIARSTSGREAVAISLRPEVAKAQETLASLGPG